MRAGSGEYKFSQPLPLYLNSVPGLSVVLLCIITSPAFLASYFGAKTLLRVSCDEFLGERHITIGLQAWSVKSGSELYGSPGMLRSLKEQERGSIMESGR